MESTYLNCLALFGVGGAHPGGLQLTKNILSKEKIDDTMKILDVGCGTGQTSAYLSKEYGCQVTALDCHKIMLEKAKERFRLMQLPIDTVYGNAENLPFEDGSFDMVLSESVTAFTHISQSIPEFKRVLKPNGTLLAIEMTRENPVTEAELAQIIRFYGVKQLLSEPEWCAHFQRAGFNHVHSEIFKLQTDAMNMYNAVDFSMSKDIDDSYFQILNEHQYLSMIYQDKIGCRIFRCRV
ncbi:class I SAM-dependent methyltransferase [Siminovitchia sp. 179-K 8D1 HS]|uniref:class I SAM-dependent methyltransferase n=1 Tax=Siminovitchia sp. 179-K 8D1 HS TaxID=3142385 RepID=UPI0039A35D51